MKRKDIEPGAELALARFPKGNERNLWDDAVKVVAISNKVVSRRKQTSNRYGYREMAQNDILIRREDGPVMWEVVVPLKDLLGTWEQHLAAKVEEDRRQEARQAEREAEKARVQARIEANLAVLEAMAAGNGVDIEDFTRRALSRRGRLDYMSLIRLLNAVLGEGVLDSRHDNEE